MVFSKLKEMVSRRGGTEGLKEDAEEIRDIARGEGSLKDKAKDAAEALKEPGAPGQPGQDEGLGQPDQPSQPGQPGPGPNGPGQPESRDEPGQQR